jgi:hypothetical protein
MARRELEEVERGAAFGEARLVDATREAAVGGGRAGLEDDEGIVLDAEEAAALARTADADEGGQVGTRVAALLGDPGVEAPGARRSGLACGAAPPSSRAPDHPGAPLTAPDL